MSSVLETCRFPAHRLQLEVTETYVLENPERARMAIANLKALGTAVALDDFGTGYSSIGYLRRFNFDTIKIDKSLAGLVDDDEQAAALVSGTVRIANALGMAVVAEGVETEKQMKLLRLAGCDQLQGFWFSQPMPMDRTSCNCVCSGWAELLALFGQRFQLVAKTGHGQGPVIGAPAIFCRRCRALHANQLPAVIGFQHQR